MKKKLLLTGIALVLLAGIVLCILLTSRNPSGSFPTGDWAFASDPSVSVIRVGRDGRAQYQGKTYTLKDDGRFLTLTGGDGETLSLRYRVIEKTPYLYVNSEYSRKEGTAGEGIIGVWDMDGSEKSFFEFTANGRFLEDGVFDGTYQADEENGSFTLVYPMYFNDTVCYYQQDGEHMKLEYPWSLVETQAGS